LATTAIRLRFHAVRQRFDVERLSHRSRIDVVTTALCVAYTYCSKPFSCTRSRILTSVLFSLQNHTVTVVIFTIVARQ